MAGLAGASALACGSALAGASTLGWKSTLGWVTGAVVGAVGSARPPQAEATRVAAKANAHSARRGSMCPLISLLHLRKNAHVDRSGRSPAGNGVDRLGGSIQREGVGGDLVHRVLARSDELNG